MKRALVLAMSILFLWGMTMSVSGGQRHHGQPVSGGAAWGPNFIDQDGDGVCDHVQTGDAGQRHAPGRNDAPCDWCGFGGAGMSLVNIAANLIGTDRGALVAELRAGGTLAQVLAAHGKSTADLVNAVVAQRKGVLDQAVAEGRLSTQQADEHMNTLRTHVERAAAGGSQPRGQGNGTHCPWSGGPGMHRGAH